MDTCKNGEDATTEQEQSPPLLNHQSTSATKTTEGIDADVNDDTGATVVNGIVGSLYRSNYMTDKTITWLIAQTTCKWQTQLFFSIDKSESTM